MEDDTSEAGLVPCAICGKWVMHSPDATLGGVSVHGRPVHEACLNRICDFCDNPHYFPVSAVWDVEKDDYAFMCQSCARVRDTSDVNDALRRAKMRGDLDGKS